MSKPKLYKQKKDDCWRIALCNLLNISPKKVPHFVQKYKDDFVEETRKWLNKRGKSIIYVPFNSFLEGSQPRYNPSVFPEGKCIATVKQDKGSPHACLMVDGKLHEDPAADYDEVKGYFIVYNI